MATNFNSFPRHLLLLVLALVCFVIAVFVSLGDVSAKWDAALVPAGLAFLTASFI